MYFVTVSHAMIMSFFYIKLCELCYIYTYTQPAVYEV